jgi:hypothetical protein
VPATCEISTILLIKIDELAGSGVGSEGERVEGIGTCELVRGLSLVGIPLVASLLGT